MTDEAQHSHVSRALASRALTPESETISAEPIRWFQHALGNQAVQRMIGQDGVRSRMLLLGRPGTSNQVLQRLVLAGRAESRLDAPELLDKQGDSRSKKSVLQRMNLEQAKSYKPAKPKN